MAECSTIRDIRFEIGTCSKHKTVPSAMITYEQLMYIMHSAILTT